jgi:parallel beta-helix repeat protein
MGERLEFPKEHGRIKQIDWGKRRSLMSSINYIPVRPGLRLALVFAILGLLMFAPVTALARGDTVFVPPPNGTDDTANLQTAFDACVAHGPLCTVQLAAGNYLTKQLVAYNFRGTFKGKGKGKTTVEALPELTVNAAGGCKPNTTDCLWPSLIIFVDGDILVSDMSIKVTAVPATTPNSGLTTLFDAVRIMGQYNRTNASVKRVTLSGMPDSSDTSFDGFNLINGVIFAGELPRSSIDLDYYFLSGTFSVTNSSFNTMFDGASADGFFTDSHLTIGGSRAAGNVFDDLVVGIDLESLGNSIVEVSHNTVATGTYASAWAVPWCCWLPTNPSLFLIHDNTFKPTGPYANGIYLLDDPTNKWIYALIYNNTIEAQDIGYGGISAYSTKGTTIMNNKISGNGADGIGIWDGTSAAVLGNDVTNFTASPDLAQIVLDGTTTHSTVLCKSPNDTVQNLGTDNKLIGCQAVGSSVNASKMSSRPSKQRFQTILKGKALVR